MNHNRTGRTHAMLIEIVPYVIKNKEDVYVLMYNMAQVRCTMDQL